MRWIALACALATNSSLAQLLELGRPPEVASGPVARALADDLLDAARADQDDGAAPRAKRAFRRIAARLLESNRSSSVLLGRSMAHLVPDFDDAVEGPSARFASVLTGSRLGALEQRILAGSLPPTESIEHDLREALAPILDTLEPPPPASGWTAREIDASADTTTTTEAIRALERRAVLSEAQAGELTDLLVVLDEAESIPTFTTDVRTARSRLHRAALAMASPPGWMPRPDRGALAEDLVAAARGAIIPDRRDRSLLALARVAVAAESISEMNALPESRDTERIRGRLLALVERSRDEPARWFGSFAALRAGLALRDLRAFAKTEPGLVRQLRVPWRELWREARRTSARLDANLDELFAGERPESNPAVISLLLDQRAARRTLEDIVWLNDRLANTERSRGGRPAVREEMEATADRVMQLGRRLDEPGPEGRAALIEITAFAADWRRFESLRGEHLLSGDETSDAILGDRAVSLRRDLDAQREQWRRAWSRERTTEAERARQRLLEIETTLATLDDLRTLDIVRLNAWPAWELDDRSSQALAGSLRAVLRARLERREPRRSSRELAEIAAFTAALARALPPLEEPMPLAEIALGPPDTAASWLAVHREAIASLCRSVEESLASPDPQEAAQLRAVALFDIRLLGERVR
ncbi:MAG: hypothetical protein AAFR38_09840 [Planctomycetota bacterium]